MAKLCGFCLSIAYIACPRQSYIESLPTLWLWSHSIPSLLLQQVDILSDTYTQLIPLALEVESKGLLLRAPLFRSCWSQLVDPEFEHLQQNTVLASCLHCTWSELVTFLYVTQCALGILGFLERFWSIDNFSVSSML